MIGGTFEREILCPVAIFPDGSIDAKRNTEEIDTLNRHPGDVPPALTHGGQFPDGPLELLGGIVRFNTKQQRKQNKWATN